MIRTTLLALMALPFIYSCDVTASAADPSNIQWVKYPFECTEQDVLHKKLVAENVPFDPVVLTGALQYRYTDANTPEVFHLYVQPEVTLQRSGDLVITNCNLGDVGTIVLGY